MTSEDREPGTVRAPVTKLRVAVLTRYFPPAFRGGGPIQTISAMVSLHGEKNDFRILSSNADWRYPHPLPGVIPDSWRPVAGGFAWYSSKTPLGYLKMLRAAAALQPDYLYLNSLLEPRYSVLPLLLRRFGWLRGARLILAPRGETAPAAMALKAKKKTLFLRAARLLSLHRGVIWHASSPKEAGDILAMFPSAQVHVRANETPVAAGRVGRRAATRPQGPLRVIYASRITPKKRVHFLLRVLANCSEEMVITFVGQFEDQEYEKTCRALATALPPHVRAEFIGAVPHEEVGQLFLAHDVMAFPTSNENFGHVVAESLAAQCYVLIPDTTPWTDVVRNGGGRILPIEEPQEWVRALDELAVRAREGTLDSLRPGIARTFDTWRSANTVDSIFDLVSRAETDAGVRGVGSPGGVLATLLRSWSTRSRAEQRHAKGDD